MATLDLQVVLDNDDGMHLINGASDHSYAKTSDNTLAGSHSSFPVADCNLRYPTVGISSGVTIVTATLTFTPNGSYSTVNCHTLLHCESADDPGQIADESDWHTRSLGSGIAWNPGTWTNDVEETSPELKTIVQAVVDRGGWNENQAIQFFWKNNGSTASHFRLAHSVSTGSTKAVKFHVEYTEAGSVAASSGSATVTGIGESDFEGVGSSSGVATVLGIGESDFEGVGSSSGVATVLGVGDFLSSGDSIGSSSGVATVLGVGASTMKAQAQSSGIAMVIGISSVEVVTNFIISVNSDIIRTIDINSKII